jgi:hypothetical protein
VQHIPLTLPVSRPCNVGYGAPTLPDGLGPVLAQTQHDLPFERSRFKLFGAADDTSQGEATNETAPPATRASWRSGKRLSVPEAGGIGRVVDMPDVEFPGISSATPTLAKPNNDRRTQLTTLPPNDAPLTFQDDIKPLFRERDRSSMLFAFDLWSYDDVSRHSDAIVRRLRSGTMPCDGAWPEVTS